MDDPAAHTHSYPYRAFLGIPLNPETNQQLNAWVQQFLAARDNQNPTSARESLRWVRAENRHITLNFLGNINQAEEATLTDAFGTEPLEPGLSLKCFTLAFEKLAYFPHADSAVLAATCNGSSDLTALHNWTMQRVTSIAGSQGRPTPFVPHITLARHSNKTQKRMTVAASLTPKVISVTVNTIALFKSELKNTGSQYTVVRQWRLP